MKFSLTGRNRKKITILILMLTVLILIGCAKSQKSTAYCFSALFEKNENVAVVTLFCKKNADDALETADVVLSGVNFEMALDSTDFTDYEIFFGSNKALFFGNGVTNDEKESIILLFLNHAKFHSDCKVYAKKDNSLYNTAKDICNNEKIKFSDYDSYLNLLEYAKLIND